MERWTREEAQQRAAWSRSGASEWEIVQGGAAQPSADDDDYLKAARQARSKRIGTLSIPVPDEDFDAFDFESVAGGVNEPDEPQLQHREAVVPLPPVAPGGEGVAVGTDATLDSLHVAVPQWYPPREPVGKNGEDTLPVPQWYPPREPVGHSAKIRSRTNRTTDSVHRGGMQQQHDLRQTLDQRHGYPYVLRRGEQIAPEPESEVERTESRPSFANE